MEFSALAGNDRLKEQLSQQESGRGLAHAYIISGPTGSGRHTLARLLAAAMVCTSDSGGRDVYKRQAYGHPQWPQGAGSPPRQGPRPPDPLMRLAGPESSRKTILG